MSSRNAERMTEELTSLAPHDKDQGRAPTVGAKRFRCTDVFASGFCEISLQTS